MKRRKMSMDIAIDGSNEVSVAVSGPITAAGLIATYGQTISRQAILLGVVSSPMGVCTC